MAEIIKETVTTQANTVEPVVITEVTHEPSATQTTEYVIYFFLGALEVLLAFRLILKLLGASTASAFVRLMYSLTGIFILPFEGIFRRGTAPGIETTSIFEPSTVVAIVVYAIAVWGIVKLLRILTGQHQVA